MPGDADVIAASAEHRWAVLWQAREDTDGNGVVQVYYGEHGGRGGDRQDIWIVLGGGPGVRVDRFLDGRGRWLAVVDDGDVQLIDSATGTRTVLGPSLGEWAWDDDPHVGGGPEVRFADGEHLVWLPTRDRIVVTSTSTEQRSEYGLAGYWIAWAHTDATATWIFAGVLARAPDDPGDPHQLPNTATSYRLFPCRRLQCGGPASAPVAFRIGDPRPIVVHTHSVARAWGLVTVFDHALRITRSADDMRSVGLGCRADLVHAGIQAPLVIYRCRGADDLMFSIDGSPPQPIAALDPSVLPEVDRELLSTDDVVSRLHEHDDGTLSTPDGEHAWDASTSTWRFYSSEEVDGCVAPRSLVGRRAERRLASTHCIRGQTHSVFAVAEDGAALVRRSVEVTRVCSGTPSTSREPQLVWTHVAIEPHATTPTPDEPPPDPATTP